MTLVACDKHTPGVNQLSKKSNRGEGPFPPIPGRRDFLKQSCLGAGLMFTPAGLRRLAFELDSSRSGTASEPDFHLHPTYRAQRAIAATLLKVDANHDNFASERYAQRIDSVFAGWRSSLLESATNRRAIEKATAPGFRGSSLRSREVRPLRTGIISVTEHTFAFEPVLERSAFFAECRSYLQEFSKLHTADFHVTRIDSGNPSQIKTRVRYELVGTGAGFHREQRIGYWEMQWQSLSSGELLLTLWQALGETRSRSIVPIFDDITAQVLSKNRSYAEQLMRGSDYWRSVLDGASGIDIYGHNGVSIGDIDNDGYDDLYVCQPAGLPNRLFRNRGDGTFDDITESSGVGVLDNTACALFLDTRNIGRQDLIVVRTTGPILFLNEGTGKFRVQPDAFRFATPPQGTFTGAAAADYDRDGWLDIYFCLYSYYQGTEQYSYPVPYYDAQNGPPNFLFRNNRDATFTDVTAQSGLDQNNRRYSFCCAWADFDGHGWPDLYVVNDFGRKNLYRNNGNGTFTDIARQAGVEDVGAGMSVNWFDYDNDGAPDLHVANMWTAAGERLSMENTFQASASPEIRALYQKHAMGNSLFRNRGSSFQDATRASGVGIGRWAWSSDSWDFDHDGFLDLYVTNGMVSGPGREDLNSFFWRQVVGNSPTGPSSSPDYEQAWNAINELIRAEGTWSGYERNLLYANNRNGTFSDASGATGLDFLEDGRSFVLADFDHDGRQELVIKNRNSPQLRIMKNVIANLPPSISFRLRGTKSNRDAVGAVVTLETEPGRQSRMVQAGSGFLSQHSKELFFGLGEAKGSVHASIRWPNGYLQDLSNLPVNHRISVEEGSESLKIEAFQASATRTSVSHNSAPEVLPDRIETWLLAPVSAPHISLPDIWGRPVSLSDMRGKPVLIYFWTVDSTQCKQDLAVLQKRSVNWAARNLRVFSVNFDSADKAEQVRTFVSQQHLSFPVVIGTNDNAAVYNLLYRNLFDRHRDLPLPTSFLLDSNADIVKIYQGTLNAESVGYDFQHIPRTADERIAKALPFPGTKDFEFSRNYLSLGSVFFQQGYYTEAGTFFQNALRDDPSSAEAFYGIGSVQLKQEKLGEAAQSFTQATQARASYPDTLPNAWNNLGIIATREHRMTDAIHFFQQALHINPGYLISLVNLGNAYRELKRWNEARTSLDQALQFAPGDAEASYGLGMVYAQTDDEEHAKQYLLRALRARPIYPEALNNLGILLLRTNHRDEAVARFQESIRVAPVFDQSYLNLARVYAIEGDRGKARDILLELLKQHPEHAKAKEMLQQLER